MPRQAHGRPVTAKAHNKRRVPGSINPRNRKPPRGKGLNALEAAEQQFPDQAKVRRHRLGEIEDDSEDVHNRANADERSSKRRKVTTTGEDDESEVERGSDSEGNEWHLGLDEDDDDSDIESDEAFGESDEERFADFTFRGSKRDQQMRQPANISKFSKPVNLAGYTGTDTELHGRLLDEVQEDEDYSEDDLGREGIDLAAAWDMDDEDQRLEAERVKRKSKPRRESPSDTPETFEDSAESYNENSEDSTAESDIEISEDEDKDVSGRLRTFIEGITPSNDSRKESLSKQTPRVESLPNKPSQFGSGPANISAAELMPYVTDPMQRQSLRMLTSAEKEESSTYKGGIPGKLSVPLAKRQQDRLDRAAAYDKSKETMERWVDTVKENRRAEHLSFPLPDPAKDSATNLISFQPIARGLPQTELETKIQQIMSENGFGYKQGETPEEQEQAFEELQERTMPLEELQARRRALRAQRELMFREEVRARRIKKIKSKAYRKVHRKEREKFATQERERLSAAGLLDSDDERERSERKRAEERMGARHRESKWAKSVKATGQIAWNRDARSGVTDLARRDEELRQKIQGRNVRESGDSASNSESENEDASDTEGENQQLGEQLRKLGQSVDEQPQSKLAGMAFMQRAEAVRKAQNDEEIRQLRKSLQDGDQASSEESNDEDFSTAGRQKFGAKSKSLPIQQLANVNKSEFEEKLTDDEDETEIAFPAESTNIKSQRRSHAESHPPATRTANPEPQHIMPRKPKRETAKPAAVKLTTTRNASAISQTASNDYIGEPHSEENGITGMDEADALAIEIFAGDDEQETRKQFEKEKKKTVEEEDDQVVDNTLPGWGSWTGAGISKRERKGAKGRFLSTVKGVAPGNRQDARLDRVIINERRVKKNGKYLATELPHPYESRAQYERSLRLPMGPEWSTRNHFQDAIKPRVLVKQGSIIQPLARPKA